MASFSFSVSLVAYLSSLLLWNYCLRYLVVCCFQIYFCKNAHTCQLNCNFNIGIGYESEQTFWYLRLFYDLHIYLCHHLTFFKVMPTCYPQEKHVQEGHVPLIFVVLPLQMATNVLVIFVPHNKRGLTFSFNLKLALQFLTFRFFPFLSH